MRLRLSEILVTVTVLAALLAGAREVISRSLEQTHPAAGFELTELAKGMNIVLIVFDTTPGKSLDLLDPKSAPLLSKHAREAAVFTKAYSAAPWTRPAIASILTGYHPQVHGVRDFTAWYNSGIVTLGQMLRLHGYETAGFVSHWILSPETTFRQGFEQYRLINANSDPFVTLSSPRVADAAVSFIKNRDASTRSSNFFLFAHFFDPHFNYIHHPKYDKSSWYKGPLTKPHNFFEIERDFKSFSQSDFSYLRDLHLEEVSFTEYNVERIFTALETSPYADNTVVIVMADHGEEFDEHGALWHGHSMYDEVIRVPLMVWAPKKLAPRVVSRWVSSMDVLPSLVSPKELVSEEKFFGKSLFSEPPPGGRWLYSEVGDRSEHPERSMDAVLREPLKLIVDHVEGTSKLFELQSDPAEKINLISDESLAAPLKAELMESTRQLSRFVEQQAADAKKPLTAAQVRELRSLGYLSGSKLQTEGSPKAP